ncbi:MAG: FAD-binding protein [Actinomycetota bacterium]|jgi:electron transfer flavoprotein alpha subunit|nr:FAD-binding protein [Actinomycetota bacterium]
MGTRGRRPASAPVEGPISDHSPLRVAVLVKQVPSVESLSLGAEGRIIRDETAHEMNPFCRRAVSKGVELARATSGTCIVFTLGPPSAVDVLREAVAWGADRGVHVCDPELAGSDTLATSRALVAALLRFPPFDLIVAGRSSIDGDTAQLVPQIAELMGMPCALGVRHMRASDTVLNLELEHDDGTEEVELELPAVISVAERLCEPCKVPAEEWAAVDPERIRTLSAAQLGAGPWGQAASGTSVGVVRTLTPAREGRVLRGDLSAQVSEAIDILGRRGALDVHAVSAHAAAGRVLGHDAHPGVTRRPEACGPLVGVVVEPDRVAADAELLGTGSRLAGDIGGSVVALVAGVTAMADEAGWNVPAVSGDALTSADHAQGGTLDPAAQYDLADPYGVLGKWGADHVLVFDGADLAEDVARGVIDWAREHLPSILIAPSTAYGREVAGRVAVALGAGLIGDAIAAEIVDGRLVATKPAFSGAQVAEIRCTSKMQMVTFRPGMLEIPAPRLASPTVVHVAVPSSGRQRVISRTRDDDVEVLARARAVIGVGMGVDPHEYTHLEALAALLGAELAATRKVTDLGRAPRSRQVGITGRSISPVLYVGIGLSGKFNHMVGTRSAGTVLLVNSDPRAPGFAHADVGIVGDWREVVPLLEEALRARTTGSNAGHKHTADGRSSSGP